MDDNEVGQLIGPMLQRRLFVCLSEGAGAPDEATEGAVLAEHLRHVIGWERSGVLFSGGPFLEAGVPGRRSMYILRVDSAEEAHALLAEEPLHKRGLRTSTVHEWSLNEGRITVHVDFSTQQGGLDGRTPTT